MKKIPFSEDELKIVGTYPASMAGSHPVDRFDYPVSPKENYLAFIRNETPCWMPNDDYITFCPAIIPDNVARAWVIETDPTDRKGGPDMFGVEWEYIAVAGGSMVKPGKPVLSDIGDWPRVIKFPDVESWDWEGCAERNRKLLSDKNVPVLVWLFTGLFERLISFMDFENAAVALIDDEQKEDVAALFDALCGTYEKIIDKCIEHFGMSILYFHDDWGSQMAPFFSAETFREMILPYMKRLTSYCHERNVVFELHSCGHIEKLADVIAETGIDMWRPQPMNDFDGLYRNFGDKFKLGYRLPVFGKDAADDEKIKAAKDIVAKYSLPGKYIYTSSHFQDPVFRKALYKESRIAYSK